jgi:hypothetical protein
MVDPQVPEIESFLVSYSMVRTQHWRQLIAADIDNHLPTAARQQHLGEAFFRSGRIEGSSSHAGWRSSSAPMSL